MNLFFIFLIICLLLIFLCLLSKCFENSYMARLNHIDEEKSVNVLDFDVRDVPVA